MLACDGEPEVVLLATGSEVGLALAARQQLSGEGIRARVVSMPSWELFEAQSEAYRASVLPAGVPRVAVEAGVTGSWGKYVGLTGSVVGLDRFGASGPFKTVYRELGITADAVVAAAQKLVNK